MRKRLLFLILIQIAITLPNLLFSQETIYHRDAATTGNWLDPSNPWYRVCDGWWVDRPDKNVCNQWDPIGRNYVFIGHNNNPMMMVNGAWFQLKTLTLQAGASVPRIFNEAGGGISLDQGIYNDSPALHTFNVPIGVDGPVVEFQALGGGLVFNSTIFINTNIASFLCLQDITVNGVMDGTGGVLKLGPGTLILNGNNDYNGLTISEGTLQIGDGVNFPSFFYSNIINNSNLVFNTPSSYSDEFAYDIEGTGTLIKTGGGSLWLSGTNTYTGNTTVQEGELWLYSDLASGTITVNSGAKLVIKGTEVEVNNLVINSGGELVIAYEQSLTINGNLTNNGNVSIQNQSSSGSSGSLIVTGTITGSGALDYYLTIESAPEWGTWNSGWHFLSSPVASQAISAFETSGENNDYDFYGYHEPTRQWVNYKEDPEDDPKFSVWNGPNFVVGRGYLVSYQQTQYNLIFSGSINNADVPISNLSYTSTQGKGWHLLGNPFPSAIYWNDGNWALSSEVAGNAKIWNSALMSYTDISADGVIPAAQGFYVQVDDATNSLTIPKASRTHSTGWYKSGAEDEIRLVAKPADGSSAQHSIIRINPEATNDFDFYWDSRFLAGGAPKFFSQVNGEEVSTNTLKEIPAGYEIPFEFESNGHTDYTIELAANDFNAVLVLIDLKTGIAHDLSINPVYTFTASEGEAPIRFLLKFSAVGVNETSPGKEVNAWIYYNTLYVNNEAGPAFVEVFDLMGRRVYGTQLTGSGLQSLTLNQPAGIYIVRINTGNASQTIKANIQ
ncbi:MAG: autotransporter-associated beta strand repeat-containing protein [Bacteroidales bacterium]|nr:autotransporter-associated beta strand repeat-containing protein [Bacteroidales bacterium]